MSLSAKTRLKSWFSEGAQAGLFAALLAAHVGGTLAVVYLQGRATTRRLERVSVERVGVAFDQLARTIAAVLPDREGVQQQLQKFNAAGDWDELRVMTAAGHIRASLSADEIDTRYWQLKELQGRRITACETSWLDRGQARLERVLLFTPVPASEDLLLQGTVRTQHLVPRGAGFTLSMVGVMLLCGAGVMACCMLLSRRFRTLSHIGSNLVRHRRDLQHEISSLRLAGERSAVADTWNQLIRLFEDMRDALGQASAYRELSHALERGASMAFIKANDHLPEGVLHVLNGDAVGYVNAQAARLLGLEADSDQADRTLEQAAGTDLGGKMVEAIRSAFEGDRCHARDLTVEGGNGDTYRVKIMPVGSAQRCTEALVRISDISQQAIAEKAREDFVSQVAHELRTPLTNIRAYAETYAEFDDPEVQAECFNVITKETRRLSRLVEEMLSRAQLDLGQINIRRDDVDLSDLLQEAARDMKATAEDQGLTLKLQLPSKLPILQADRDKLAVVVNNLLGNAVKYTDSGGIVTLGVEVDGDAVRLQVGDTGVGIAEDERERIFERGYRSSDASVQRQRGTGIGLTTALEIVRAHGGFIQVESEAGQGSVFSVELPLNSAPGVVRSL